VNGEPVELLDPVAARSLGIVVVHQEAELFPILSVAENMALMQGIPRRSWGLIDWNRLYRAAQDAVSSVADNLDVRLPAGRLSVAHRHMTQVAAAVAQRAKIIILDEPTSALTEVEAKWLFDQIGRLQSQAAGVIYISHRQEEVLRLADRITVLRDGRVAWSGDRSRTDRNRLVEAMVGREVESGRRRSSVQRKPEAARLRVSRLTDAKGAFSEIDLTVNAGECVGIYGLVGAGRSEFAHALFGLRPLAQGEIHIAGRRHVVRQPRDAVRAGIAYVPENRLRQSLCGGLSVRANLLLASLQKHAWGPLMRRSAERRATDKLLERLAVRYRSAEQPIRELSGGNQQKVVLGRWLLMDPTVLILDEPTRGVDVGAKAEIHSLLRELAGRGSALIMISSELPEVMQHADRIVVFRRGRIAGEFDPQQTTPNEIARAALPLDQLDARDSLEPAALKVSARFASIKLPRNEFALLVLVVAMATSIALTSEGFHVLNLLTNASLWVVLGLAAAVVIIAGGIDISIGSILALSAACAAIVLRTSLPAAWSIPSAIGVAALVGTLAGLTNAAIALLGRIHPIVVTLGTMTVYRGLVIALLDGKAITGLPPSFGRLVNDPESGFRGAVFISALIATAVWLWLTQTCSGRYLYAVGSGPAAARLAGISRTRVWLLAFGCGGMLAGLAGVLQLALSEQMQSRLGVGWELNAIAVAVIGGVAITGGRGSVGGVVLSALLLRLIHSGLVRWRVTDDQFELFVGVMILAAVLFDLGWQKVQGELQR